MFSGLFHSATETYKRKFISAIDINLRVATKVYFYAEKKIKKNKRESITILIVVALGAWEGVKL